jgi:hypothetical protein
MSARYVIKWKSKESGRCGYGKATFTREEAEKIAAALNAECPGFEHVAVAAAGAEPPEPVGALEENKVN